MGGYPAAPADKGAGRPAGRRPPDDQCILWRLRAGTPWRDVPERYGPRTTLYNRFVRWRAAGGWDRILDAVSEAYDGDIVMIDSSCLRVHQHGATGKRGARAMAAWAAPAAA